MHPAARYGFGAAASLAVLVLAGEACLRWVAPAAVLGFSDVPLSLLRPHARLGYELPPSAVIEYSGIRTQLTPRGRRGKPAAAGAPVAILALGDELTFGWGVADDLTYPAQLDLALHRRCAACGRVVNAGIPGYTSYQGLMLLRQIGARLRPRVVVIAFHLNDAWRDGAAERAFNAGGETDRLERVNRWLRSNSAAYGRLWSMINFPESDWWRREPRVTLDRYWRNLGAIAAEAHRVGAVPLYLNVGFSSAPAERVSTATRHSHRRGWLESEYHAVTREVAEAESAPVVEFTGTEANAATMMDDVHPNVEGYRRIAEQVADVIEAKGFLSEPHG